MPTRVRRGRHPSFPPDRPSRKGRPIAAGPCRRSGSSAGRHRSPPPPRRSRPVHGRADAPAARRSPAAFRARSGRSPSPPSPRRDSRARLADARRSASPYAVASPAPSGRPRGSRRSPAAAYRASASSPVWSACTRAAEKTGPGTLGPCRHSRAGSRPCARPPSLPPTRIEVQPDYREDRDGHRQHRPVRDRSVAVPEGMPRRWSAGLGPVRDQKRKAIATAPTRSLGKLDFGQAHVLFLDRLQSACVPGLDPRNFVFHVLKVALLMPWRRAHVRSRRPRLLLLQDAITCSSLNPMSMRGPHTATAGSTALLNRDSAANGLAPRQPQAADGSPGPAPGEAQRPAPRPESRRERGDDALRPAPGRA